LITLVALGCATAPPPPPPEENTKPVGTKLLKDTMDSEKTYTIGKNDGHGLGKTTVRLEGEPVWPPSGPNCEKLITCCTELAAADQFFALSCQLAIGRDRECAVARQTVAQMAAEQKRTPPPSCRE
jgi:hypothetical protein